MIRRRDKTSAALIEAARTILEADGPEGLTVRRIAAEAGMSTMNVYSRFNGKDGVIDELYADGYRRLADALGAVPATGDVVIDIVGTMAAYRMFAVENPTYYRIMFRTAAVSNFHPSDESSELAYSCLESLARRITIAQERGEIAIHDGWSPVEIAGWIWATCHGLVALEMSDVSVPEVSWDRSFEHGSQAAVRGLLTAHATVLA